MSNSDTVDIPEDFQAALDADEQARELFAGMPPSHKREYIRVITGAKRPETRVRRIKLALQKIRSWQK